MNHPATWKPPALPPDMAFDDDRRPVPVVMPVFHDDEQEPDDAPLTTPLQAAALRFACHLEARSMDTVANDLGVSTQALSDMVARIYARLGFRRGRKRRTSPV
jgi:hypothetical protein